MPLRWTRVRNVSTTELLAPSAVVGVTYRIARYDGQSRRDGQWRLMSSAEDETLDWARTLRGAKAVAEALDRQRVAAADRRMTTTHEGTN